MDPHNLGLFLFEYFVCLCWFGTDVDGQNYYVDSLLSVTQPRVAKPDLQSQNLYIGSLNSASIIYKVPIAGGTLATFSTSYAAPLDVCFDTAGNVYVADTGTSRIVKVSSAGGAGTALSGLSLNGGSSCIFDSTGKEFQLVFRN